MYKLREISCICNIAMLHHRGLEGNVYERGVRPPWQRWQWS